MSIKTNTKEVEVVQETDGTINLSKIEEIRNDNLLSTVKDALKNEMINSGEIDVITSQIDISKTNTIVEFGKEPALEMAKVSDEVLSHYNSTYVQGTSKLVDSLLGIMKKIDIDEVKSGADVYQQGKKKTFFDRFRKSAQEKLEALLAKYNTIGNDMAKICEQLTVYEQQINKANTDISKMYDASIDNYKTLSKYVIAGEQAVTEIDEYLQGIKKQFEETGDQDLNFEIQNATQALSLMEQRVGDLRGAEAVALQSIPTFKIQEYTNGNLSRKINSAFIVTIPAFKTALVNSIIAKQQAIQAQGLEALDAATSDLIRKNADNITTQLANSQRLVNSSAIKADDVEYAWEKIMTGIQQYKEMESQYRDIREEEKKRITEANNKYLNSVNTLH